MAYTTIDDPEAYFQVKLYTGDGSTQSLTLDGDTDMQPDFLWVKDRTGDEWHNFVDSVRGVTKYIHSNATNAEAANSNRITAFNSDGFSLGNDNNTNYNTRSFVAWCWKAGTSLSNSADTNGGSIATTGSINTTSGFGIVQYEGSGANATIYHGLTKIPRMIITKNIDQTFHWSVYAFTSNTTILRLNGTDAPATESAFQSTDPTATVQSLGDHNQNNGVTDGSADTHISYMFCDVQGFQKIGKYEGNGNADGTFVFCGLRPAYIMIKRTDSTDNWIIFDNKRPADSNPCHDYLKANASAAEDTDDADLGLDFLSNGFKLRGDNAAINADGGTYVYAAFAEAPFVNSNGVPCNAR